MSVGANLNTGTNTADKTTPVQILPARTQRDALHLSNTGSANNIYIAESAAKATAAGGHKLIPGAPLPLGSYNGPVWVFADNATASVSWSETY